MKASIIIPTRNRAVTLAGCLDSLTRQTVPPDEFEVVVVDNGSSDDTHDVVQRFAGSLQVEYAYAPAPGLHVGRHEGMRRARSDVLMFADDDIEAGPHWVETVSNAFSDKQVGLVGGNNLPLFEATPPPWLSRWWSEPVGTGHALGHLSIVDFGEGRLDMDPGFVWGCNFSIHRRVLLECGGFHPDALPRDLLRFRGDGETHVSNAVRRAGLRCLFDSGASVHHWVGKERMTVDYFEQRAHAQGISHSYATIRRHGGLGAPLGFALGQWVRRTGSMASARIRTLASGADPVTRELESIKTATTAAFWRGYAFHRQEVVRDPALLAWVLRPDYFDTAMELG